MNFNRSVLREPPEAHRQRLQEQREQIAAELLKKYPTAQLERLGASISVVHYTGWFADGKIHTNCHKLGIYTTCPNLDHRYLSEEAVKKAIKAQLLLAKAKFQECLAKLQELQSQLQFELSYVVLGDTHGVEDWPCINFKQGGFDFSFRLDD